MAIKHTERYSTSLLIKEMKMKITRYHHTLIRIAKKIKNCFNNTKCWLGCRDIGSFILLGRM